MDGAPSRLLNRLLTIALLLVLIGCSSEDKVTEHYFLDGYDHLEFRSQAGDVVTPEEYIFVSEINGVRGYFLKDSALTLYNTRQQTPYSGYIRTFHGRNYNLQGEFENGKMFRLRYWYGNRTLGMDVNYRDKTGTIWNNKGQIAVSWNAQEMYYLDPASQTIERIISDTLTSHFDEDGELEYFTVETDTTITHYYVNGTPRFQFPISTDGSRRADGIVKRWHPNGQLQVIGEYKNGWQSGTWIEYDSLGNVVDREVFER